ncbi:TIGR00366 family protein [Burkholderia sp. MSMB1826]|uniref:TIGR00366 family protein n=1 Tax=Burkholderia sp. MSMB1826 TaxID=1637875 RepID=UPI00075D431B|nr:TIGR00366 family protein [Burkholderia sp. MSMB1826]KVL22221.1 serine--pyruvate aminotransferase [Burkholderia sp. MSMB1826]
MRLADSPPRAARIRLTDATIRVFERTIPDPFVLALLITAFVAVLAVAIAPRATPAAMIGGWTKGFFDILTFTAQMALVFATGHALAHAPLVQRGFRAIVSLARTPAQAATLVFLSVAVTSFVNWAFGLVISALLAREVAKRLRVDFAWIVACGFSGWVVWASGLSSSIALAQSTRGSAMNVVEKLTGHVLPFSETVLTRFNLAPTLAMLVLTPALLVWLTPGPARAEALPPDLQPTPAAPAPASPGGAGRRSPAQWLERSCVLSALAGLFGLSVLALTYAGRIPLAGVNVVILAMLTAGVLLHGHPLAYAHAIKQATAQTGSLLIQYPLYGGIMGLMDATGLPGVIAHGFIAIATADTLPFWSYVCSLAITFLIPSGGGHWAVQGPFVVPAAVALHASLPATTMAVAMGEQVSNMMQPFWVAPVVAMAGIGVQRVLGYTALTFLLGAIVYGCALLWLV